MNKHFGAYLLILALAVLALITWTASVKTNTGKSTAAPNSERAQGLNDSLRDVVVQLHHGLRLSSGDLSECGVPCLLPPFASSMRSIVRMCEKVGPDAIFADPAYDPKINEPLATAFSRACERLLLAEKSEGGITDSAAWRAAAAEAAQTLATALAVSTSKPR